MDGDTILQILILVGYIVFRIVADRLKKKDQPAPAPPPEEDDWDDGLFPEEDEVGAAPEPAAPEPASRRRPREDEPRTRWPPVEDRARARGPEPEPAPVIDLFAEERARFAGRLDALIAEAERIFSIAHLTKATRRVADVLRDYVVPSATALRGRVRTGAGPLAAEELQEASSLALVSAAVETFIEQRRNDYLGPRIVDSDAMAQECYGPVLDFARMNRLPLTSATPVTMLSPFDLGIWTGFIPTGVAPIFLPPEFFDRVAWWPALAHEVGHDFLASTRGADQRIREQLGIPSESAGAVPLTLTDEGLSLHEIHRVFGAWFEEMFCDVFGTLMVGPAYGYSMIELFSSQYDPSRVTHVALDPRARTPRYDTHPPRHLRVMLCAHVLDLVGELEHAERIRDEWTALHGEVDGIVYPVTGGAIGVPVGPIVERAGEIANSLYRDGLDGFDGHSLSAIPGVDWGPHLASASRRARDSLLAGRAPTNERARAVIAGAVLAWRAEREREAELISLARRAIVGVTEHREDLYDRASFDDRAAAAARDLGGDELRDAFVIHTVLAPPPSLRSARRAAGGLISRRHWHHPRAWQ